MKRLAIFAGVMALPFAAQANFINNGDFESGYYQFTSSYTFITYGGSTVPGLNNYGVPPSSPATDGGGAGRDTMYDEGTFTVTNLQPGAWHGSWRNDVADLNPASQGGHGYYMLLNGATTGPSTAWNQAVSGLVNGTTYYFSFDIFTAFAADNALASLELTLGSVNLGSVIAPTGTQQWKKLFVSFVYDSNTMGGDASILNLTNIANGNDFGIDNIVLSTANPVPEPFTMTLGALGIAAYVRKRRASKA